MVAVTVEGVFLKKSSLWVCLVACVKVKLGSVRKGLFLSVLPLLTLHSALTERFLGLGSLL